MKTQEQFYKSKAWTKFRKVIIEERTESDGFVRCAMCGKPILKKYDMVLDHIKELDDISANDASIALNPDNIQILHFRCHNQKHNRFVAGHAATYRQPRKHVYIVYGSPCAGKSTWVRSVATEDDLVVDLDDIWEAVTIMPKYQKPGALKSVVFELRDKLYDIIKYRSGKWANAYVITGGALAGDRERLMQRIGADEMILIDATEEECLERIGARSMDEEQRAEWRGYIREWFQSFQPEAEEEE